MNHHYVVFSFVRVLFFMVAEVCNRHLHMQIRCGLDRYIRSFYDESLVGSSIRYRLVVSWSCLNDPYKLYKINIIVITNVYIFRKIKNRAHNLRKFIKYKHSICTQTSITINPRLWFPHADTSLSLYNNRSYLTLESHTSKATYTIYRIRHLFLREFAQTPSDKYREVCKQKRQSPTLPYKTVRIRSLLSSTAWICYLSINIDRRLRDRLRCDEKMAYLKRGSRRVSVRWT